MSSSAELVVLSTPLIHIQADIGNLTNGVRSLALSRAGHQTITL